MNDKNLHNFAQIFYKLLKAVPNGAISFNPHAPDVQKNRLSLITRRGIYTIDGGGSQSYCADLHIDSVVRFLEDIIRIAELFNLLFCKVEREDFSDAVAVDISRQAEINITHTVLAVKP